MDRTLPASNAKIFPLSLAALGIVYGDIGTSPLYAFRESLHGLPINMMNIFGILSLIFWSLVLVVSVKYLCIILRADNDGEGGVLSLLALLKRQNAKSFRMVFLVGIFGASLLLGDGMLTPAISVLSAVEGLAIVSPSLTHLVLPLTVIILIALFFFQYHGSARIGKYFGPIIFSWFFILAVLGLTRIIETPAVLHAINPYYAAKFFINNGWTGYILLGGIFLVVTGGEALYADLGHFAKTPIRLGWFGVVLPALLLNYFGQGAFLLQHPEAIENPFYDMAPNWFSIPLLAISTIATIIASQAVISATFSLAKQAILLDFYPRMPIIQTSESAKGQIYVPQMNMILALGTLILVVTFGSSSRLAHAYGIAVNLEMFVLTFLVMAVAHLYWKWSIPKVTSIFLLFVIIDLAFLGANIQKIKSGGWAPLLFAALASVVMITWFKGMQFLRDSYYFEKGNLKDLTDPVMHPELTYLPNTSTIFITDPYDNSGGALQNYLRLNNILPQHILIVSIAVENHPYITGADRYKLTQLNKTAYRLLLHYGFMQLIDIPAALAIANEMSILPTKIDLAQVTYLIEIAHVTATTRKATLLFFWQEKLFAFLMRNAALDIEFFKLPYDRTIAIGTYCEI